jgi:hypothetical protein
MNQEKASYQDREKVQRQKQKDREEMNQAPLASLRLIKCLQHAVQVTTMVGRGSSLRKEVCSIIGGGEENEVV